jgi:hypothetical protein
VGGVAGRLGVAGLVALAVGGVTSYLQTVLPHDVAPLANSAGPWCLVAFALAWRSKRVGEGAVTGAIALGLLVAGYYLVASLRGFGVSSSSVAFWCLAAVTVGPVLGTAAVGVRRGRGWLSVVAALVLPVLLIGEGLRSLAQIADSTSSAYWIGEIVLAGVLLLPAAAILRRTKPVR